MEKIKGLIDAPFTPFDSEGNVRNCLKFIRKICYTIA